MKENMNIKKCTLSDISLLATFNKNLIEDEKSDNKMNLEELTNRMRNFLQTDYDAYFFECNESIVGYALVNKTTSPFYLRQFYIDRPFRRMHYGKQAFYALLEYLSIETIDIEVLSWNKTGIQFWESLNFNERSRYYRFSK